VTALRGSSGASNLTRSGAAAGRPGPAGGVRASDAFARAARYEGKLDARGIIGAMANGSAKAKRADG
jgi:hypothetical protein